jgi:molybdopterin/thiamine biosynthesis adenylyltransferase
MSERQFLHEELYRGKNYGKLKDKVVVMAGCGAIGSWTATFLARMGVANFRLIDKDRIEDHNVSTQTFLPANVGQYKTRALQEQLYRISKARCELQPVELTTQNLSLLHKCDLVICTFDNSASRQLVKSAALSEKITPLTKVQGHDGHGSFIGVIQRMFPCVFAGMNGQEAYFEVVWAESYKVPKDPEQAELDPCAYPLSTPLVTSVAAATAEIAVQYLLTNQKLTCRQTLNQTIS